jgi:phosphoglycolate phosphatase
VIFDLDGTLVDSGADIAAAANAVRERLNRPRLPEATVVGYVGDGARKLLERSLAHPDRPDEEPEPATAEAVDAALAMFLDIYGAHLLDRTRPYPGIMALLQALGPATLMVATNKPRQLTLPILAGLDLAGYFERVVAGDDVERRKPHPDHLRACLAGHAWRPARVAMVGDSPNDVAAARALGLHAVAVGWGLVDVERLRAAEPDALVVDVDELANVLGVDGQS